MLVGYGILHTITFKSFFFFRLEVAPHPSLEARQRIWPLRMGGEWGGGVRIPPVLARRLTPSGETAARQRVRRDEGGGRAVRVYGARW